MEEEIKIEPEAKAQQPDSPKQASKKTKKDGLIKKRTKTGCKTCRHRRVKCDEARPICRNCVKSRRPCTWHDPTQPAIEQQNAFPATAQFSHYQHGVDFTLPPLGQLPMQYRHNLPSTGGGLTYGPELQQNIFPVGHQYYDHSPDIEWPNYIGAAGTGDVAPWLGGQPTWLHPQSVGPLPYYHGLHASSNPELNTNAYSAYPGMPPDSNNANWHSDSVIGSASAASPQGGSSAIPTDTRQSSLRADNSDMFHATSSQLSPPLVRPSMLSRATSYQGPTQSHSLFPLSEDTDSTDDSWDESSEDFSGEDSALINLHSTQALAIDERKAYLLRHFVNNIRPCLSMSEPPLAFDGSSTWGEIIPCLALSCPGLLHGLMAASALHLAVLHGTNEGVPTKHFMVASKRLHRLLETPGSRHQLQTLSLCLLLAWYEVMNGDHARWIMHLGGASSFLLEHIRVTSVPLGMLTKNDSEVDEDLVEQITGFPVSYSNRPPQNSSIPTFGTEDVLTAKREWRARLDLFWWYIKMDVFHSFLSGDRLLLPYRYWNLCPPRGRIGLKDKVHASVDHLWLVLGRLAEFGGKDRLRKQRQVVASGGQWKPPPGFLQPEGRKGSAAAGPSQGHTHDSEVPSANEGRARSPKTSKQPPSSKKAPPMNFYGMMPPPTIPPSMLSSFHVNDAELRKHSRPDKKLLSQSSVTELKIETERALKEHLAIEESFEAWRFALGSDFEPLDNVSADTDCPFQPILRYDDPLVACMWSLYYLGRILLRRYHPYSPPAMMVSAGVNAKFTQEDAANIGRINGGLLQSQVELAKAGSINPTLVAALQEMTFPMMFAGVQYQSAQQRSWVMDNLLEFAKAAGWKSAYAVASALETAWTAQAENGRAPPYERILNYARTRDGWVHARQPVARSQNLYDTPESQHESRFVSHDRGLITTYADARAYWAIGLLSSTDDMQKMFSQIRVTDE